MRSTTATRLVLAAPLLVYLILPTRNFYWDGLAFAINIEKQVPLSALLHPSHLLYSVLGRFLYRAVESIGIHTRALFILQAANSLLAGASVILLYRILRLRRLSPEASAAGALLLAFSATWWKFATDADAYIPAIFLILCAYCVMESFPVDSPRTALLAGAITACAMLLHELAIFFLPVGLIRIKTARSRALFLLCSLIPTAAAYWLAYQAVIGKFTPSATFLAWITQHATDSGFSFRPLKDVVLTLQGTLRLFFGGRIVEIVPGFVSALAIAALGSILAALLFQLRTLPRLKSAFRSAAFRSAVFYSHDLLLWACIYAVFLFFWMPQNTFYRLFYLAPLIAVLCLAIRGAPEARALPWLAIGCMALWNFAFLIYPQSRIESNPPLRFAMLQNKKWPGGTAIVFHTFHPDLWTISYFNQQAAWIGMDRMDLGQLDRNLAYARSQGQPLWMEATAWDLVASDPAGRQWLLAHAAPGETLIYRDAGREFRFHLIR